ncbi:ACP S-malonyltransferase [Frateuria aurantia]
MTSAVAGLALVFPGQGSQSVGMLAELAAIHPEIQASFAEASQALGYDLWQLASEGPEQQLNQTEYTQPALLAASVGVWRAWRAAGGAMPARMAGHSLGEYSALVCAGVLALGPAAALVAERGRLMQQAVPAGAGAMAAILGADDAQILAACEAEAEGQVVAPANYNSPGQLVIAGDAAAVDRVVQRLSGEGIRKIVKLAVSVPSHCALMKGAAEQLGQRFAELDWASPQIPVIQNADAQVAGSVEAIREALQRQLYLPVRWTECVQALVAGGASRIVECGPGKVLSGLVRRIDKSVELASLAVPADFDAALGVAEVSV